jgi:hypothetical protein
LLGWDAADWKVIRPLIDANQPLHPPLSPMLWTSITDGRGVRPVTNLSRKTKAIWNVAQAIFRCECPDRQQHTHTAKPYYAGASDGGA